METQISILSFYKNHRQQFGGPTIDIFPFFLYVGVIRSVIFAQRRWAKSQGSTIGAVWIMQFIYIWLVYKVCVYLVPIINFEIFVQVICKVQTQVEYSSPKRNKWKIIIIALFSDQMAQFIYKIYLYLFLLDLFRIADGRFGCLNQFR